MARDVNKCHFFSCCSSGSSSCCRASAYHTACFASGIAIKMSESPTAWEDSDCKRPLAHENLTQTAKWWQRLASGKLMEIIQVLCPFNTV